MRCQGLSKSPINKATIYSDLPGTDQTLLTPTVPVCHVPSFVSRAWFHSSKCPDVDDKPHQLDDDLLITQSSNPYFKYSCYQNNLILFDPFMKLLVFDIGT